MTYVVRYIRLSIIHTKRSLGVWVYTTIFNNVSVISWWSVLLVEETGEIYKLLTNYHFKLYQLHLETWTCAEIEHNFII